MYFPYVTLVLVVSLFDPKKMRFCYVVSEFYEKSKNVFQMPNSEKVTMCKAELDSARTYADDLKFKYANPLIGVDKTKS